MTLSMCLRKNAVSGFEIRRRIAALKQRPVPTAANTSDEFQYNPDETSAAPERYSETPRWIAIAVVPFDIRRRLHSQQLYDELCQMFFATREAVKLLGRVKSGGSEVVPRPVESGRLNELK